MNLSVTVAEQILRQRFCEPAKPPTQYVIGFRSSTGRVLGLGSRSKRSADMFINFWKGAGDRVPAIFNVGERRRGRMSTTSGAGERY
jgi:hypothetical protein